LFLVITGALVFIGYGQWEMNRQQSRVRFFDGVLAARKDLRAEKERIRKDARYMISYLQRKQSTFKWCNRLASFDKRCLDLKSQLVSREEQIAESVQAIGARYAFIRAQLSGPAEELDLNGWDDFVAREDAVRKWREGMEERAAKLKKAIQQWAQEAGGPGKKNQHLIQSTLRFARDIRRNPVPYWGALNALGRANQ